MRFLRNLIAGLAAYGLTNSYAETNAILKTSFHNPIPIVIQRMDDYTKTLQTSKKIYESQRNLEDAISKLNNSSKKPIQVERAK